MDESVGDVSQIIKTGPNGGSGDDILAALADRQRRHLLAVLHQVETPEPLSALTRNLAVATDRSGDEEIEHLRIRLYHSHIPKLEDAGLVDYDEDQGGVDLTESGETVAAELDL